METHTRLSMTGGIALKRWEISSLQAAMLVAGVVALTGHALAVSHFMQAGGRDAWLSGLFALPAALLAIWAFDRLGRLYPGMTVVQYAPKVLGYAGYPVAVLYGIYYFIVVVFTVRMTTDWMVDSILTETPSWIMGLLYMAAVFYAAVNGLDVLARVNQFILPLLTFLGFVVSFGTIPAKDYSLLLPMFEKGPLPVFVASLMATGYYGETSVVAMMGAYVARKDRPRLLKANAFALLFIVTTLTGPLAGSAATLGYRVAQNMPYPTFQHWLMLSFARFFERTDLLAVHQWLAGAYVRCGLFLLLSVDVFLTLTGKRETKPFRWSMVVVGLLTVMAAEWAFPSKPAFDIFVNRVYFPAGAVLGILMPVIMVAVAWARGLGKPGAMGSSHGS